MRPVPTWAAAATADTDSIARTKARNVERARRRRRCELHVPEHRRAYRSARRLGGPGRTGTVFPVLVDSCGVRCGYGQYPLGTSLGHDGPPTARRPASHPPGRRRTAGWAAPPLPGDSVSADGIAETQTLIDAGHRPAGHRDQPPVPAAFASTDRTAASNPAPTVPGPTRRTATARPPRTSGGR